VTPTQRPCRARLCHACNCRLRARLTHRATRATRATAPAHRRPPRRSGTASNIEEALEIAAKIGRFPLIIRPAFTLGGTGGGISYNMEEFKEQVKAGIDASMTDQVGHPSGAMVPWRRRVILALSVCVCVCVCVCVSRGRGGGGGARRG
jgi:hypothetical protein